MTVALKIDFADAETSYRRVHQLPIDRNDFNFSSGRKRAFESVFLRVDDVDPTTVVAITRELLTGLEILSVTPISEAEFWAAPSHGM